MKKELKEKEKKVGSPGLSPCIVIQGHSTT